MHPHHHPVVAIFYKKTKTHSGHGSGPYNAGGLAANALHTTGVLRKMGVHVSLHSVKGYEDLLERLHAGITHAVVEAVWLKPGQVVAIAERYPNMKLVIRAHSKMGFLQVEPETVTIIRELIALHDLYPNILCSSNNQEFSAALSEVYGECLYLPNLYDLDASPLREKSVDGPLRIASFGASRLLKLHSNAALAALQIAKREDCPLEFYVNTDGTPGKESVRDTIRNLFVGLDWATLIEVKWQDSATFKETIADMDLLIQLSCTETFCLVAADAVAAGVPVVVGPAITWLDPKHHVEIDDTSAVAKMGEYVLEHEHHIIKHQRINLEKFVHDAKRTWERFLDIKEEHHTFSLW